MLDRNIRDAVEGTGCSPSLFRDGLPPFLLGAAVAIVVVGDFVILSSLLILLSLLEKRIVLAFTMLIGSGRCRACMADTGSIKD
jgi:hypothetical protein